MKKILASVILVTTLLASAFAETYDGKCDIREWIAADAEIKKEISPNVSNEELTKYLFDMYGEMVSYEEREWHFNKEDLKSLSNGIDVVLKNYRNEVRAEAKKNLIEL